MEEDTERLGFFSGMLFGMLIPLMMLGSSVSGKEKPTEAFFGGVIFGILFDIALVVGLIFLFGR